MSGTPPILLGVPDAYLIAMRKIRRANVLRRIQSECTAPVLHDVVTRLVKELTIDERERIVAYVCGQKSVVGGVVPAWIIYTSDTKRWFKCIERRYRERHPPRSPASKLNRNLFAHRVSAALFLHTIYLLLEDLESRNPTTS